MAEARLATPTRGYTRLNLTSQITFTQRTPTATKPTVGVIYDATGSVATEFVPNPSLLTIIPWQSTSNASTNLIRVWGWTSYLQSGGGLIWFPRLLLDASLAYPTNPFGVTVDGADIYPFATITATASITPTPVTFSPGVGLQTPAQVTVDPLGSQIVTVAMSNATTAQFCGVFWATV
jgi:hypothetical protein